MSRPQRRRTNRKPPQTGKALRRVLGDAGQILFPDGGAPPLKVRLQKFQNKARDGHGSHHGGKHKLG
ncbi:MAG: hypothetical protein AAGE65_07790 [Planctomycetota bacterium]